MVWTLLESIELEREKEVRRKEMTRVQCVKCKRKDTIGKKVIGEERREILCPEYRTGKKKP